MKYQEWKPLYEEIRKEFNYSEKEDRRSRDTLMKNIESKNDSILNELIKDKTIIFGNSPELKTQIKKNSYKETTIVADSAIKEVMEKNIIPDIVVTDLDGDINYLKKAKKMGSLLVVHSHGDNIDKIKKYVPKLNPIIGTTQTKPINEIKNFGGFTDGDRAAFLAEEFGTKEIQLIGFNFKKASDEKLKKLKKAKKLIKYLEKNKKIKITQFKS